MNTTKIGDEFEALSYTIIENAIVEGKLGIYSSQCRMFRKKGYYSKDREKEIIFDMTIEVWPPEATNYSLLYIVECKSYSSNVPVNDIEEFYAKIQQVAGVNVKGVIITNSDFQEGAFTYGRSKGMMLIRVNFDSSHQIILHRIERFNAQYAKATSANLETWDDVLANFLDSLYDTHSKVTGLEQLSADMIEGRVEGILHEIDEAIFTNGTELPIDKLIKFLEDTYKVKTDFEIHLGNNANCNPILGYFDKEQRLIRVDKTLVGTERFLFTLGHEVGHVVLHQNLKLNHKVYNQFQDSVYNFMLGKHELKNDKNWIEWQANQFSACLILPRRSLWARVYTFQQDKGIRNPGTIYYDEQPVNRKDFNDITTFLSTFFGVSYSSVKYRLSELGVLTYSKRNNGGHWTNYFSEQERYQQDPRRALRTD